MSDATHSTRRGQGGDVDGHGRAGDDGQQRRAVRADQLGEPVVLEISSDDVHHGFNLPTFNVRADAIPGMNTRVKVVPDKTGTFAFYCDYYCGSGHEGMAGQLVVE